MDLPYEINYDIMLSLSGLDLLNMCKVNTYTKNICNDERFWKDKLQLDYGHLEKPINESYKEFYINLAPKKYIVALRYYDDDNYISEGFNLYLNNYEAAGVAITCAALYEDGGDNYLLLGINYMYPKYPGDYDDPKHIVVETFRRYEVIKDYITEVKFDFTDEPSRPIISKYVCTIEGYPTGGTRYIICQFDRMDFLNGVIMVCEWYKRNPHDVIIELFDVEKDIPITF